MQQEEIQVQDGQAMLLLGGHVIAEKPCSDLYRFYIVHFESAIYHGEEPFYIAVFSDCLWVIPYFTSGVLDFLAAVAPHLEQSGQVFRATSPPSPISWRRRLLGLLPIFPTPRLDQHPLSTMPPMSESGPFRPSELPEFCEENTHG